LLVGLGFAKGISLATGLPLVTVHVTSNKIVNEIIIWRSWREKFVMGINFLICQANMTSNL
jgi:tRNA A37 threonylcarbamoyltransferase TsaD